MPAGDHVGASGQEWDQVAIETAVELELEAGLVIRHASAAAFLALKWAAFADRGAGDPFASHDLEDIIGVIASRPRVVEDVRRAPESVRVFVRKWSAWLRDHRDRDELLAANLRPAFDARVAMDLVRARLVALAP